MIFYEVSAKNNLNIEKAFRELAIKVIARQEEMSKQISMDQKLNGQKLKNNKKAGSKNNNSKANSCC